MLRAIGELRKRDEDKVFLEPVDPEAVPGYLDFVDQPMDLRTMEEKVRANEITTFRQMLDAFKIMCKNCIRFNGW